MKDALLIICLWGTALIIATLIIVALVQIRFEERLPCPPQNMLDGGHFTVDFSYTPTPEDQQWMTDANGFFRKCDETP